MAQDEKLSALAATVLAFDAELRRFDVLVDNAARVPLDSRRNLQKAARITTDAAQCQQNLAPLVQAFNAALNAAREHNQHAAERLQIRGAEIKAREQELIALMVRFGDLGEEAAAISVSAQRLGVEKQDDGKNALGELAELEARMTKVIDAAQALGAECRAHDFADVGSEIDALKQQMQSARNKVLLLRQQLGGPGVVTPS